MPPLYSDSVGGYLQSGTGARNALLAVVAGVGTLRVLYSYSTLEEFFHIALALLFVWAVFVNLWREALLWALVSALVWGGYGRPFNPPLLSGVILTALCVIGFGFLFGEVLFPRYSPQELRRRPPQQGVLFSLSKPGRYLHFFLSFFLPLTNLNSVPYFFYPQDKRPEPKKEVPVDREVVEHLRTLASATTIRRQPGTQTTNPPPVTRQNPASPKQNTAVMSAPLSGSGLYVATFVIECVSALVRSVIISVVATFVLSPLYLFIFVANSSGFNSVEDNIILCASISLIVGFGLGCWPLLMSLFHMVFPFSRSGAGSTERDTLGAREPTRDEMEKILETLWGVKASGGRTIDDGVPSTWLILDEPFPDAYTIGSTIYLSRAAVESDQLSGIMAHEMGHVAHNDGDLLLSLRRFVIPLVYWVGIDRRATASGAVLGTGMTARVSTSQTEDERIFFRFQSLKIKLILSFWFGGLGLLLLGRHWAHFWRQRDFLADDYAHRAGQADSLMEVLETYRHIDVAQPYLLTNRPYTAERLDRLKG